MWSLNAEALYECRDSGSPQHIMKSHIPSVVQPLHLIAHVFKQQLVFVQVHLQPASQEPEQELHPRCWDHTLGGNRVIPSKMAHLTVIGSSPTVLCC